MSGGKKYRVAIVYQFYAHYRRPIIEELVRDKQFDYYFLGGDKRNASFSSLKLYDNFENSRFIKLKNFWFLKFFLWQGGLMRALKIGRYDAVIFLGDWKYLSTWRAVSYLNRKNTPALFWGHGVTTDNNGLNNRIKLFFLNKFKAGGFLYDNRARSIMLKMGYKYPLTVIYNSLDYNKQIDILKKLNNVTDLKADLPVKAPYVIFTGRIIAQRKLELMLDAMQILREKGLTISALLIGTGPHLDKLKNYACELNITDNVVFYGECYDEELIGKYFLNAVACVFPGPMGLTAIHSLTYGVPVITNNNRDTHKPEIEAVKENINGLLFDDNDPASLAQKMEILLNLPEQQLQLFKENATKTIGEKFTPQKQVEIMNARMKTVLQQSIN